MEICLTIIIPTYNRNEYADKLLKQLDKQMENDVEVILVDDFSDIPYQSKYKWLKIIRLEKNSGGASVPRNVGLDNAKGKYITFVDVDDLISEDYIKEIKNSFKYDYDYCYFSWKSKTHTVLIDKEPPSWNCCVWNCIYKKDLIGDIRFNPELRIAEDYEFNQKVRKGKHRSIKKVLYYYNIDTPNSLIKGGGNSGK